MPEPTDVRFFQSPAAFRRWLRANHAKRQELWVGYLKKETGRPSITWPESVDEARCCGWIDGIRKRIDGERYAIRFTPRKRGSIWSAVNIRRAEALIAEGRMEPAGLAAFGARREDRSGIYSYEQRPAELPEPYAGKLRRSRPAANYFEAQPPSYRRAAVWWVVSARREETRLKRLEALIAHSVAGRRIPQFTPARPANE